MTGRKERSALRAWQPDHEWRMGEVNGTIRISNDAIASIAAVAANEVNGAKAISRIFRKSIKANVEAGVITLEIPVSVNSEAVVPQVCMSVQERVKSVLESTTGLQVGEIKITVAEVTTK